MKLDDIVVIDCKQDFFIDRIIVDNVLGAFLYLALVNLV